MMRKNSVSYTGFKQKMQMPPGHPASVLQDEALVKSLCGENWPGKQHVFWYPVVIFYVTSTEQLSLKLNSQKT